MGATGLTIRLQPLQGADLSPVSELQSEVWDTLAQYLSRYTQHHTEIWETYINQAGPDGEGRWFEANERTMTFWFPDFSGCCRRSAGLVEHWFRAALAANYDKVAQVAQDHGWLPEGDPPELAEEVWKRDARYAWIPLDEGILEFSFEPDLGNGGLHGDDESIPLSELSDKSLAKVEEAVERGLCPCTLCQMLRPDPDFETSMVQSLQHENPDIRSSAVWYLRQTARPTVETVLLVAEQPAEHPRAHAAICFDLGRKLGEEHADTIFGLLGESSEPMHRCGLLALLAGMELTEDGDIERRLFTFVSAVNEPPPVCEIAAEYAGYGNVARGREDHFARALLNNEGVSVEYDNNVALTLFNFYMQADAIPRFTKEALARLTQHDAEQVRQFAEFAYAHIKNKPTAGPD